MNKKMLQKEIDKIGHEAVYTNKLTKVKYTLSGVEDLPHAWRLVSFVAKQNGWDEDDIKVKYIEK